MDFLCDFGVAAAKPVGNRFASLSLWHYLGTTRTSGCGTNGRKRSLRAGSASSTRGSRRCRSSSPREAPK